MQFQEHIAWIARLSSVSKTNKQQPKLKVHSHTHKKIMNDFVEEFDYPNYSLHIYNDVNVEKGVLNFSNSVKADLIGMCTHARRTGFAHFFNGSVSEDLVNHAVRPVITFKI